MVTLRQRSRQPSASIATPSALDLPQIQAAVNNIRERIGSIERSLAAVTTATTATGSASAIATLQAQVAQLNATVLALGGSSAAATELDDAIDYGARAQIAELAKRIDALEQEPL